MPFYRFNGTPIHMRGTKLPSACCAVVGIGARRHACMEVSGYLCDWPVAGGRTCSLPICQAHAHQVGADKHYCPEHYAEDIDAKSELFSGLLQSIESGTPGGPDRDHS